MSSAPQHAPIIYPDSDGQPMSDNTLQFRWIVLIKENLETLFADDPAVFVAGDLLWYPVEGRPDIRRAPDAMVVFGRPKGYRGSYKQWEEGNLAPQVVFEVLSPNNTPREMREKLRFYERYGVEEYYLYDPDGNHLEGWQQVGTSLEPLDVLDGWVSPRLGIRFALAARPELVIYRPDGQSFLSHQELDRRATRAEQRALQSEQRATRLAEKLRALGIDPEEL
ncbi:MAG: Uma2 family endonuclease [Chloroflexaceae bacterium]|nr:Uma2 family endonuclease [Chloroflexaceae bacterium]NJL34558.1 Uma2 family endonuclease [Chloroflexaceae bacterium]